MNHAQCRLRIVGATHASPLRQPSLESHNALLSSRSGIISGYLKVAQDHGARHTFVKPFELESVHRVVLEILGVATDSSEPETGCGINRFQSNPDALAAVGQ
ncbi:hypothetical protein HYR99_04515 [Candidatus Poribacteria bacterium]|nr:hypothetical protein [Candidatus Poribacteria bacterium]